MPWRGEPGGTHQVSAGPKLLRLLNLKGSIVSLDAMGARRKIAIAIIQAGADYLLALKGKQGTLHGDVRAFFKDAANPQYAGKMAAPSPPSNTTTTATVGSRNASAPSPTGSTGCLPKSGATGSTLRSIALNLLKTETAKPKEPIRGRRIFAAPDPADLESIIGLRQM